MEDLQSVHTPGPLTTPQGKPQERWELHRLGGGRDEDDRWDHFVRRCPRATFFHLSGWRRAVEKTFHFEADYLYAQQNGEIQGILPLFEIRSIFTGRNLISVPFGVYGGIAGDNDTVENLLLEEGREVALRRKVGYLEMRHLHRHAAELPTNDLYVTFQRELPADPSLCLGMLPRKARAAARKAIGTPNLTVRAAADQLEGFFRLYSINKRTLGSPIFPKSLFANLLEEFGKDATIFSIYFDKIMVASVLVFFYQETVLPYFSGSLDEYEHYQINNFMYLKLMEYGAERGYRLFDFGRSRRDSGPYAFKKNQGFTPTPLYYQYCFIHSAKIPSFTPSNPKLDLPRRIWKHLPLGFTQWIGPKIAKYIP